MKLPVLFLRVYFPTGFFFPLVYNNPRHNKSTHREGTGCEGDRAAQKQGMVRKGHRLRAALCALVRACACAGVRRLRAARARHDRRIGRRIAGSERAHRRVGGRCAVSAVFARAADLRRGRSDLHGEQRVFRSETLQKAGVSAAAVRGDDVLRRVCLRLTRRRGRGGKLPDGAAAVRARRDERPRAFVDRRQGKGGPPLRAAFHPARRADGRVLVRNRGRLCAGSHPLDARGAAVRL